MARRTLKLTFDGEEDTYYSLATTCRILERARSTLMRLIRSWEAVTNSTPRRDHSGRWYLSVKSVEALKADPKLYLKLAGVATKWEDEKEALSLRTKYLEADCEMLKNIIQENLPTAVLLQLKSSVALLKDLEV